MKTIVIGLIGEKGSGKGTFVEAAKEVFGKDQVLVLSSREWLGKQLDIAGAPRTRENLQDLFLELKAKFGPNVLTKELEKELEGNTGKFQLIIFDAIRYESDEEMIRRHAGICVYITADPETRFLRLKKRGEKVGEAEMTWDQFMHEENKDTEKRIPEIGKRAEKTFVNNGLNEETKARFLQESKTYLKSITG